MELLLDYKNKQFAKRQIPVHSVLWQDYDLNSAGFHEDVWEVL